MRTPQQRAWSTINWNNSVCDRYGLPRGTVTKKGIDEFCEKWNPSELIRGIYANLNSKIKTIAKATGTDVSTIKRFLPHALESLIQGRPVIGMQPLKTPELIKYRESLKSKNEVLRLKKKNVKETRGRKLGSKTKLNPNGEFESEEKNIIHDTIVELLQDNQSPKKGIVLTLPFVFTLESRIVETTDLPLNFQGYEFPYHLGVKTKSRQRESKQSLFFKHNPHMKSRMSIAHANINDIIMSGISDQYAHVFADYCGTFKKNKVAIEHLLKNNIVQKGGIVWVTLSMIYDKGGFQSCMKMLSKYPNYEFQKIENQDVYKYNKMYVFILRRVK